MIVSASHRARRCPRRSNGSPAAGREGPALAASVSSRASLTADLGQAMHIHRSSASRRALVLTQLVSAVGHEWLLRGALVSLSAAHVYTWRRGNPEALRDEASRLQRLTWVVDRMAFGGPPTAIGFDRCRRAYPAPRDRRRHPPGRISTPLWAGPRRGTAVAAGTSVVAHASRRKAEQPARVRGHIRASCRLAWPAS